jgi:hypothetical protein
MKITTLFIFLLTVLTVSATPLNELLKRGGGEHNGDYTCEQGYQACQHGGYSHFCWDDGQGTCQCKPCEQLRKPDPFALPIPPALITSLDEWGNDHISDHYGNKNLYCTHKDYSVSKDHSNLEKYCEPY